MYTDMTYNMQGDMVTKFSLGSTLTPADGILEVYVYDDNGNLTDTIINPGYEAKEGTTGFFVADDSIRTRAEYDKAGNITYQTDALGNKTGYGYDDKGKLKSVTLPGEVKGTLSDLKYEYTYDEDNGSYTTKDIVKDPKGNKSIVVKDYLDQTLQVADIGSADSVGENSIATSYEYDIKGNLTKATEKEGNYKIYSYDTHDRVTAIEYFKANDSRELKTVFTYDSSDNLLTMRDYKYTSGSYVQYRYTGYEYDEFNRLISVSECNKASDPTDDELEAGKIRYDYDSRDNLIGIKYPDNDMGVAGIALTYDKITGLVTKAEAVTEYLPNTGDEENWEAASKETIREYSYNHMNQVSTIRDYTDFLNDTSKYMLRSYRYDDFGRPVSIEYTDNMSGSLSDIKEAHYYTYDKNYNIIEEKIVNKYGQVNGTVSEETRSYSYDELGRLVSTSIEKVGAPEEFDEETGDPIAGEDNTYIEQIAYEYDAAGNRTKVTKDGEETDYSYNGYNQLTSAVTKKLAEGVEGSTDGTETESTSSAADTIISTKTYTYDKNGNQLTEVDVKSDSTNTTTFTYDSDNRLVSAQGKTGDTVDYTQENGYNGFGQRILKKETKAGIVGTTNYFYDGTQVLYTTDAAGEKTSFNIIGAEDNILTTARFEGDVTFFYTYTKDLRESTINLVGSDGTSAVSYEYDDFGETTEYQANADEPFYNEVCYSAGIYDDTTGLYYLNARYYDPADAIFLTQDTYRGDRSRTYTLNYYAYCAGNPISYTDPTGHWVWGVVGAAMGAYDGYKYAKKKKLKGVKKAAAIVGGAALGAINPFKVVKAASKAGKLVKNGVKAAKALKNGNKLTKAAKATKAGKLKVVKPNKKLASNRYNKVTNKAVKKASNGGCFVVGTKIHTKDGYKNIEAIKVRDYVWSEDPTTNEKALKSVKKIFVREKDSIIRLSINGEIIETTDEHPFYVEGRGFVAAAELKVGDEVKLFDNEDAYIDSIEEIELTEPIKVYNFEVEDFHTYYVSEQKVLVHNMCMMGAKNASVHVGKSGKQQYIVGAYKDIRGLSEMTAHHVGQGAVMKNLVSNYNYYNAPAISVPSEGHIFIGANGRLATSTKGIYDVRQLLARDIKELRRVYRDIPNSALKELINLNKKMYTEMRK